MVRKILTIALLILLIACNADSTTSIVFDMIHANPKSDYWIYSYLGDLNDEHLVLGSNEGIILFHLEKINDENSYEVLVEPIVRPVIMAKDNGSSYVLYYEQSAGDENATLKAIKVSLTDEEVNVSEAYTAHFKDNDSNLIDIANVYTLAYQGSSNNNNKIEYTIQLREKTNATEDEEREITFYYLEDTSGLTVEEENDSVSLKITPTKTATAWSSAEIAAPYICGSGYIAYLDEDESYYEVFSIEESNEIITPDSTGIASTGSYKEIIAYYAEFGEHTYLVDNSGYLWIDGERKTDYGSFPLDNRRVAYSTIINGNLYIVYKYGPEVLRIDSSGSVEDLSTSDINDETVVGIKYYGGTYYVITEESEVIATRF